MRVAMLALAFLSSYACLSFSACAAPKAAAGSATWDVLQIAKGRSLRAISAPSREIVWCSGTGGTVLRSEDGGRTFASVGPRDARELDFRSLVAFDREVAVIANAGRPARVYRTEDGGTSWTVVHEDAREGAFFDALAFADARRGYLLGDPIGGAMSLFATDDGGRTWQPVPGLPLPVDGEAMFAASCTCLFANGDLVEFATGGTQSRVFRSRDRGRTWNLAMLPLQQGKASQGAFAYASLGNGERVVVGGDHAEPATKEGCGAYTEGGGIVFLASRGLDGYHSGLAVAGERTVVAVGPRGAHVSRDGGATYAPFGDTGFHAVAAIGDTVYAVGADGRFGRARP